MTFNGVGFLKLLQGKYQELCVMLIRKWASKIQTVSQSSRINWKLNIQERNRRKLPTLKPVNSCSVNGNSFFSANVRAILQVTVLPLLLSFEI
jgi:hypothetical protein